MHEIIELFIIGIISFAIAFLSYSALTIRYYKRKIKKLKKMAIPDVMQLILSQIKEFKDEQLKYNHEMNSRLIKLELKVEGMSVKLNWKASLVGILSSGLLVGIAILMKGI